MTPATNPFAISQEVRFNVLREDWSKYYIYDGAAEIWARAIIVKVFEVDRSKIPEQMRNAGEVLPLLAHQLVVTSFFPPDWRGPFEGLPISPAEILDGGEDVEFEPNNEPQNEYITIEEEPRVLRVRCVVTRIVVNRKRFSAWGDPVSRVDAQIVPSGFRKARPNELER